MSDSDPHRPIEARPEIFIGQESELRAGFARQVGERLDSSPGVWRLSSPPDRRVQFYVANNFLSAHGCEQLCRRIDANSQPSPLYEKEKWDGVRTSFTCIFGPGDPVVDAVDKALSEFLGIDAALGEPLQGQRYQAGQQFKEHADFFYVDQPYWSDYEPSGGQRTWTAMIYLNQPERGGATGFRHLNLALDPLPGRLLAWNNMDMEGRPNPFVVHEGKPVEAGTKYILTKWYRERPYVAA